MSMFKVLPVRTAREKRIFLTFPWRIYSEDPLWVPPLIPKRKEVINPDKGVFFKRGEADFFIAWKSGKPVGTICAAEDKNTNAFRNKHECMFGFFDCVNDYEVAEALFNRVKIWAGKRGLNALFGPFNLDYEDSYGILIEGRDRPPAMLCGHTPSYYRYFFEQSGFEPARGENLAFALDLDQDKPVMKKLSLLASRIRKQGWITVRGADFSQWDKEVNRIHRLLTKALAHLPDHIPWHPDALKASVEPFRKIADPELILFAEVDGKAVGWFPGIPNLNEIFIHVNGLRNPWDYLKLFYLMRRRTDCLTIKSILVLPEYWSGGVSILLFDEMAKRAAARGYKWIDLSLTSSDNPYTPALAKHMGAKVYKRYQVYRLMLDKQ